jgi:hypothetical protein
VVADDDADAAVVADDDAELEFELIFPQAESRTTPSAAISSHMSRPVRAETGAFSIFLSSFKTGV